jgi:hypothetical protein
LESSLLIVVLFCLLSNKAKWKCDFTSPFQLWEKKRGEIAGDSGDQEWMASQRRAVGVRLESQEQL